MDDVEGGGVSSAGIGDVGDRASSLERNLLNKAAYGVTGGFAPRLGAAYDAATGNAPSYADALKSRNQDQTTADASLGPLATGAQMAGSALPMLLGGGALQGASLGGRAYGGLLLGSGTGAIEGAASAPDLTNLQDVGDRASMSAMMGGALGAGLPLAGAAAGAITSKVAPFIQPSPVEGMSRGAFGLLSAANGPRVQGSLDSLGPDAMLLDAAPQMKGLAQGVAIKPGDAQDALVDALRARNAKTNDRLATDRNAALGPSMSPADASAAMDSRMTATGPMYAEALGNAGPIDITPVQQQLARALLPAKGGEATALNRFGGYLQSGTTDAAGNPLPEDWAEALQRAKFQMDADIAKTQAQTGSAGANATREMTGVRSALNDAMAAQMPGYADANLAYSTAARGAESFDRGRGMLGNGNIWAPDHAAAFGQLPLEQQALERAGARSTIEQSALDSPNDLMAQRRAFGDALDTRRGKSNTYFGPDATQDYVNSIDRNTAFRNNYNEIVNGSNTANKLSGSALIDAADGSGASIFPKNFTMAGLLANAGESAARGVFGRIANASGERTRMDLARALTATGPNRAPIANPLAEALRDAGQTGSGVAKAASSPQALAAALAAFLPQPSDRRPGQQ